MIRDIYLVWSKNFLLFKKSPISSIILLALEPIIVLLAFGKGIGTLVKNVGGYSYIDYLYIGRICNSALNITFHEGTYATMSKLSFQNTYFSMSLGGIRKFSMASGELLWCATKGFISALLTILISAFFGVGSLKVLAALPFVFILCIIFSALSMSLATKAHGHLIISGLFTVIILPMTFLSGTFFPVNNLPKVWQVFAQMLPLSHGLAICRSAMSGQIFTIDPLHILVFSGYLAFSLCCYYYCFNKKISEL